MPSNPLRALQALVAGGVLTCLATLAHAESMLRCELEQSGDRYTVLARPSANPYGVPRHPAGRFTFRALWVEDGTQPGYVKVQTYADDVLVHQTTTAAPQRAGETLTWGLQRVYAPGLGQSLDYRCTATREDAATDHVAPAATQPTAVDGGSEVSMAFVGDVMLDERPGRFIRKGGDPFKPFASWLAKADVRVGNLECVVARGGKTEPIKPFTFRAHPRVLPVLARHFDVVGLANNHSGDFGPQAFEEMLGRLQRQHIAFFGGGTDLTQAHEPLIVERKGLRIALLGYNEFMPRHFEADVGRPGIAWSEDEQVWFDIQRARRQADVVIPVMHWGQEHEPLANQRQRELARLMIDAGAAAVVGGHPHVTQDIEIYRGRPIVYSLGNFVFDGFTDDDNNAAWLLMLTLDAEGVKRWQVVPGRIDAQGTPHPRPDLEAPCGQRGDVRAQSCKLGAAGRVRSSV